MNAPEKIGKYDIKRQIGRGAMGAVFEAYDSVIERRVALKLLRVDVFEPNQMTDVRARFKREAHSAGRLSHPHIVTIYDYGEHEGTPYIVMDFMDGKELAHHLDGGKRMPLGEVVRVMGQLLGALAYAHESGVVHRDIKPANIFVLHDGSLKVVDFGVARIEASELTDTGAMIGTPAYMSPEQFLGLPVDARSDIFSCGVILYQLLTGDKPFTGSVTTIMQKVLRQDPVEPSALNPTLSHSWDDVVKRALAKKPDDRYLSARQFAESIKAANEVRGDPTAEPTVMNSAASNPTVMNVRTERTLPPGSAEKTYDKTVPLNRTLAASQAETQLSPGVRSLPPVPPAKGFPLVAVVLSVLLAIAVGAGGYLFMQSRKAAPEVAVAPPPAPEKPAAVAAPDKPAVDPAVEAKARAEAEKRAAAEALEKAKADAAARAKAEADLRARLEAEVRTKVESEARARSEAESRARREAARKAESDYWQGIQRSANRADYEEYLRRYPDGRYAAEAQARIQIAAQAAAAARPAPRPAEPAPQAKAPAAAAPVAPAPVAPAPKAAPAPVARAAPPAPPSPYRGKVISLQRDWGFVIVESHAMGGVRLGDRLAASLNDGRRVELTVRRISGNLVSATPEGKLIDELLGAAVSPK